nr:hypothetical protein BaRGS_007628 [Batillaria attramentaria]
MERADVKLALTDSWELGNVRRRATVDPKKRQAGGAVRSLHARSVSIEKPFKQRAKAPHSAGLQRVPYVLLPAFYWLSGSLCET